MKRVFFFLWLLLPLQQCDDDSIATELQFAETGCANPWGGNNEIATIRHYLRTHGVEPLSLRREWALPEGTGVCLACLCWDGWNITILVRDDDVEKALALGFIKNP